MLPWLFLAFTAIPLLELWLLIRIGGWLGAGPTLLLVLVTGAVGATLARGQGVRVVRELNAATAAGRMPGRELLHGVLVLAGGLMLVTPGVLTDFVGLALMVPPVREQAAKLVARWARRRMEVQVWGPGHMPPGGRPPGGPPPGGTRAEAGWPPRPPEGGQGPQRGQGPLAPEAPGRRTVDAEYRRADGGEGGDGDGDGKAEAGGDPDRDDR